MGILLLAGWRLREDAQRVVEHAELVGRIYLIDVHEYLVYVLEALVGLLVHALVVVLRRVGEDRLVQLEHIGQSVVVGALVRQD